MFVRFDSLVLLMALFICGGTLSLLVPEESKIIIRKRTNVHFAVEQFVTESLINQTFLCGLLP